MTDGSWSVFNPEPSKKPGVNVLNSNKAEVREELKYSKKDIEAVEEWVRRHVESTWHCLGVSTNALTPNTSGACVVADRIHNRPAPWRPRRATASSSTASWTSA